MRKISILTLLLVSACAYHNPLDKADFRFQTLNTPPYVLSGWYRVDKPGEPLTVYVEKEQMDTEQREAAVKDKSSNVAYLGRPCQYFETDVCKEKQDATKQTKAIKKGITQLQKKAATNTVVVKGF
ncbi:MAG: hypothetical protein II938_03195 [Alphaproteobacteria bacterium]|nr:hypothetical protein [Alphaproteobacteria bacterium]